MESPIENNKKIINVNELYSKLSLIKEPGLYIGNKIIDRIAGPVSIYVLKPPSSPRFPMLQYPPIILFGDVHFGKAHLCDKCNKTNEGGCYRIFEDEFFQVLDEVATHTSPIDIYFETYGHEKNALIRQSINNKANQSNIMDELYKIESLCSRWDSTKKKRVSDPECPTKNIRYQWGDARLSFIGYGAPSMENVLFRLSQSIPGGPPKEHPIRLAWNRIMGNRGITIGEYATIMYDLILKSGPELSVIAKELSRMPPGFDSSIIKDIISTSVFTAGGANLSWILDVYSILRLFKKIKHNSTIHPALAIMYFGNSHILSIYNSLTEIFGYTEVYSNTLMHILPNNREINLSINKDMINAALRCVVINKPIDLNEIINMNKKIKGGKYFNNYRRYTKKLKYVSNIKSKYNKSRSRKF